MMQVRNAVLINFTMMDVVKAMTEVARKRGVGMPDKIGGGYVVVGQDGQTVSIIASFAPDANMPQIKIPEGAGDA